MQATHVDTFHATKYTTKFKSIAAALCAAEYTTQQVICHLYCIFIVNSIVTANRPLCLPRNLRASLHHNRRYGPLTNQQHTHPLNRAYNPQCSRRCNLQINLALNRPYCLLHNPCHSLRYSLPASRQCGHLVSHPINPRQFRVHNQAIIPLLSQHHSQLRSPQHSPVVAPPCNHQDYHL